MKSFIIILIAIFSFASCGTLGEAMAIDQNLYFKNMHVVYKKKWPRSRSSVAVFDFNDNNMKYFVENGYVLYAYDAIRHTYIGYQEAISLANYYGVPVMLYKHQYVGTSSGTALVSIYNPGDTYLINSRSSGTVRTTGSSNVSVYGSGGYATGNSYSQGSGYYNSNTTTTIKTPGSYSYSAVPYSNDYYDQWAIYYVKKYFRSVKTVPLYQKGIYSSASLGYVQPNVWFEVLSEGKDFRKIIYQGQVSYIPNHYELN